MKIRSFSILMVIFSMGIFVSACSSEKPSYILYIKNRLGEKEKIAEFYQTSEGLDDCKALEKNGRITLPVAKSNNAAVSANSARI